MHELRTLQAELEQCKEKSAGDLPSLKEELAEERKKNGAEREMLERKVLKLSNELSDMRREVEKWPTTKRVLLHDPLTITIAGVYPALLRPP